MNTSEVTQLRHRIDAEIAAMNQAKHGYAAVARHEVITHHLEILGFYLEQLTNQIGEKAAVEILAEYMERGV
jgi:antitoxin component HigA of HigAB toxin-antitoxin module